MRKEIAYDEGWDIVRSAVLPTGVFVEWVLYPVVARRPLVTENKLAGRSSASLAVGSDADGNTIHVLSPIFKVRSGPGA